MNPPSLLRCILLVFFVTAAQNLCSQTDSTWSDPPQIVLEGFLDVFYTYDFNQPEGHARQPFLFNHNRHNEFNLNTGIVKLGLEHPKYRANLAFHAGTYAIDNYTAEPGLLKQIFEANAGFSLNKQNNLWLDAGIFESYIGFESAVSKDNPTLTRSLAAESSPYFITGARLTYDAGKQWYLAALVTNGWQRIQRVEGNSMPSFGTQVQYRPSDAFTLNMSSFVGTEYPDTTRRVRVFNNLYGDWTISRRFRVIAGFDIGVQQRAKSSSVYHAWFTPVLIAQLSLSETWKTAMRAEYYHDEEGVIVQITTPHGFQTTGFSWNLDYTPNTLLACRVEARWLSSRDAVFESSRGKTSDNLFVTASVAVKFSGRLNGTD